MEPEKKKKIGKHLVEEYYWNGKMVVYVNDQKSLLPFEQICAVLEEMEGA